MNLSHSAFYSPNAALSFVLAVFLVAVATGPVASNAASATNPHWRKGDCGTCHQAGLPTAGHHALKTETAEAMCGECHGKRGFSVCRHRSGLAPEAGRIADFGEALQAAMNDGKVVCTTCHDMTPHCALDIKQRYRNTSFLRGGPFDQRSDQCFGCHGKSGYRQKSPHMNVSKGKIKEGMCIFCHGSVPQQDAAGQWMPVQFATDEPLSQLCNGCHMVGPHPSGSVRGKTGWFHMVVPPPETLQRMQQKVADAGGSMPLDPNTGTITCTTCHNPHNKRLEGYPIAGEKTKTKLRYANMCEVCHDK